MIIDRGTDFPPLFQERLQRYGLEMWLFRDQADHITTRGLNLYQGDYRKFSYLFPLHTRLTSTRVHSFKYITPRIRITPHDLLNTKLERCEMLHFICSPSRAADILNEVKEVEGWQPTCIYEPIPVCCTLG
jgi:hypothetical protein